MSQEIALVRYGLLMAGQPLEDPSLSNCRAAPGYFWGSLFEGRQDLPLENGAKHYPVALLAPPKVKIRCEISILQVSDARGFWDNLFEREMCYPHLPMERSLMHLDQTPVFRGDGSVLVASVFVLNPHFYLFRGNRYGMHLTEIEPDREGFVSWRNVPCWPPGGSPTGGPGRPKPDPR